MVLPTHITNPIGFLLHFLLSGAAISTMEEIMHLREEQVEENGMCPYLNARAAIRPADFRTVNPSP
jgi:hypothetical protein